MLSAKDQEGVRVAGWDAVRGVPYTCPVCDESVIPKLGEVVIHHYAHRPDGDCFHGVGESRAHMEMK